MGRLPTQALWRSVLGWPAACVVLFLGAGASILLTQGTGTCRYSVVPVGASVTANGGSITVGVNITTSGYGFQNYPSSCRLTVSAPSWVQVVSISSISNTSSTSGNASVFLQATQNTGIFSRSGTVLIGADDRPYGADNRVPFSIEQAAAAVSICVSSRLLPALTLLPSTSAVSSGFPVPLEARVVDVCGNPMTSGSVVVFFSNGDPPLALLHLGSGRWSGTWLPRTPAQTVTLAVTAETPDRFNRGTTSVTVGADAGSNPLQISPGGVVSAASFDSAAPLALGSFVSIFGRHFADSVAVASAVPLPTDLGGTSVFVAGQLLYLLFVSPNQINGMIPYDLPLGTSQVVVRRESTEFPATFSPTQSLAEPLTVASVQPAIFTKAQTGTGQGIIVDGATNALAEPGRAVNRGGVIVIYCSGLGPVNPSVTAGNAAPFSPLSRAAVPVSVRIGGISASVLFAGLTPAFVGLYQVNAFVPSGVTPGDAVPVVLTAASVDSRTVTIAVR